MTFLCNHRPKKDIYFSTCIKHVCFGVHLMGLNDFDDHEYPHKPFPGEIRK